MKIELRYFASVREAVGCDRESLALPENITSVGAVRAWLRQRDGIWAEVFAEGRNLRAALDQVMVSPESALRDGAELAFFPPVTGG